MTQLEELGLIDTGSRIDLLENKCALVVPDGNPAGIESYEDLGTDKLTKIALGNSDVPVGQYSEGARIFFNRNTGVTVILWPRFFYRS